MERLVKVNESLNFAAGIPQNKWDYGKYREMYENNLKEGQKRLEEHKTKIFEMENKLRLRGVEETEIQKEVHRSFSHQHIQLLEGVISAKKTLTMMDVGSVEELTRQKIAILEEIVSCEAQGLQVAVQPIFKMERLSELKNYIYSQLNPVGLPNPGNAYNPFLGHHYYFKISKPTEEYQRDAAFLHSYIGLYGHMRLREIMSIEENVSCEPQGRPAHF